jgi:hypothetical protein
MAFCFYIPRVGLLDEQVRLAGEESILRAKRLACEEERKENLVRKIAWR